MTKTITFYKNSNFANGKNKSKIIIVFSSFAKLSQCLFCIQGCLWLHKVFLIHYFLHIYFLLSCNSEHEIRFELCCTKLTRYQIVGVNISLGSAVHHFTQFSVALSTDSTSFFTFSSRLWWLQKQTKMMLRSLVSKLKLKECKSQINYEPCAVQQLIEEKFSWWIFESSL